MSKKGNAWRVKTPDVNFERLDEEVVAIHMPTGMYFSMENAAAEVWSALEQGADFDQLVARLVQTYEVARDQAEADIAVFIDQLLEENLIEEQPPGATPAFEAVKRQPYPGLKLEKFTDLQYLLMIDPVHEVQKEGWPRTRES